VKISYKRICSNAEIVRSESSDDTSTVHYPVRPPGFY
jgi:hypothetical protein